MKYDVILAVVEDFYAVAKKDFMIGYHFRFIENFDEHIPRIAEFWNLQLNQEIGDKSLLPFNLIDVHRPLKVKRGELGRWVQLFEQTLNRNKFVRAKDKSEWMKKVSHFQDILEKKLITSKS